MTAVVRFMEPESHEGPSSSKHEVDIEALSAVKRLGSKATLENIAKSLQMPLDDARDRMERLGRSGHVLFFTIYKNTCTSEEDTSYYIIEKKGNAALKR